MSMKRHRQPLEILAAMNVTNLLDTAFILLITFMLVAPQLNHGLKLKLPEVKEAPALPQDPNTALLIAIAKRHEGEAEEWIYLNGKRVTLDEVFEKVSAEREQRPDVAVIIASDEDCPAGLFIQVIGAVNRAGVENIGLQTDIERKKSP
ncbi:MAG TPA: biopolymer transporter ExbD [Sumerlaeia bacterium]|nr:biopolymer transporter ExbD [Sumerlaeia bacterium]